ncbi:MAG: hypothetical protein U0175_18720 [Caldilineaceae bacterium]
MRSPNPVNGIVATIVLFGVALIIASCAVMAAAPAIPEITIRSSDYSFEAPTEVLAGLVTILHENAGHETHHVQILQLKDGVTTDQVIAALAQSEDAIFALLKGFPGGPGPTAPGNQQRVTVKLEAGNYVLVCFLPDAQGVPHLAHGMIAAFTVTGTAPANQPEPLADGTVKLMDFSFALPQTMAAGKQTWKIDNAGTQPHEITLIKLNQDKTMEDLMSFMDSPHGAPPYVDAGGFQAIEPGASGWVHLDLTSGNYIAICHVPDPASGKSHSQLGMMMPFQVQ